MKRTTVELADWVYELAAELDMSIKGLLHRGILLAFDELLNEPPAPDEVLQKLRYVPVKVPEKIKQLDITREEKVKFLSWLLEVALKQFEKSGVSVGALYETFKESQGKS